MALSRPPHDRPRVASVSRYMASRCVGLPLHAQRGFFFFRALLAALFLGGAAAFLASFFFFPLEAAELVLARVLADDLVDDLAADLAPDLDDDLGDVFVAVLAEVLGVGVAAFAVSVVAFFFCRFGSRSFPSGAISKSVARTFGENGDFLKSTPN